MSVRTAGIVLGSFGMLVVVVLGFAYANWEGLAGIGYALLMSAISLSSLAYLVKSFGRDLPDSKAGARKTMLLFLAKLPLMLILVLLTGRLPSAAIYCFLATLILVYSAYTWFLATNVRL